MFILAVLIYDEVLDTARLITFGFVWLALVVFSYDSIKAYRAERKALKPEPV
jgi:chloramphenicol-sensitive protein RarD